MISTRKLLFNLSIGASLLGGAVLNSFDLKDYWITDPGVSTSLVIGATFTLILAGLIAAYVPANRAASIKPIVALRDE